MRNSARTTRRMRRRPGVCFPVSGDRTRTTCGIGRRATSWNSALLHRLCLQLVCQTAQVLQGQRSQLVDWGLRAIEQPLEGMDDAYLLALNPALFPALFLPFHAGDFQSRVVV